jgi:hypothetical protein
MKKTIKIMMMLALVGIIGACANANSNTNPNTPTENKTEEKQEEASIVGKWKGVKFSQYGKTDKDMTELIQGSIYEFKEDGTMLWFWENELTETQSYTVDGKTLTIEGEKTYSLTTLTKEKLIMERPDHEEIAEYERVK